MPYSDPKTGKERQRDYHQRHKNEPAYKARRAKDRSKYWASPKGKECSRWSAIKRKYGLTQDDWETMFIAQRGCCAMCSSPVPGRKQGWHTDHNHTTKKVRGILCHTCNAALGVLENPALVAIGNTYLEKHNV